MIKVSETQPDITNLINAWSLDELQKNLVLKMARSDQSYLYQNFQQLRFELKLRKQLVQAAYALDDSGAEFAVFKKSRCNEQYWLRKDNGGFLLRPDTSPAAGLRDIFFQGRKYAFECTTAVMIMCYKALLECIGEPTFNRLFADLYLWDGHYDKDLALTRRPSSDNLAGDIRYFKNPDFDPKHSEWQGENAIDLGNGTYFGFGIGIKTAEEMIRELNLKRFPGAQNSAYLMDDAIFPNFKTLAQYNQDPVDRVSRTDVSSRCIIAAVGTVTYISA